MMEGEGQTLLDAARALGPGLAARAAEIEALRRTPQDIVEQLRGLGVFRMYVPKSHGGLELDFPTTIEVLTELSRAEPSVGWVAMIGAGSAPFFSRLPKATYDQIYASGPDVIVAGSAAPAGFAEATEGGYRLNGRWAFASGCEHADAIFAGCLVVKDGSPVLGPDDGPQIRHFVLDPAEWTIEDTWHVAGLKGTGSTHISLKEHFVPAERFWDFFGPSCLPGPLYTAPLPLVPLMHCAAAVGIAEGALQDLVDSAGRVPFRARKALRDSPLFQAEVGRIQAEIRAARAFMEVQTRDHWARAQAGTLNDLAPWNESVQTGVWVTRTCLKAVDDCFSAGGGAALYEESPLQRRLRDMHAAAQHASVQTRNYVGAGALRLGHPAPIPMRGD